MPEICHSFGCRDEAEIASDARYERERPGVLGELLKAALWWSGRRELKNVVVS